MIEYWINGKYLWDDLMRISISKKKKKKMSVKTQ